MRRHIFETAVSKPGARYKSLHPFLHSTIGWWKLKSRQHEALHPSLFSSASSGYHLFYILLHYVHFNVWKHGWFKKIGFKYPSFYLPTLTWKRANKSDFLKLASSLFYA
jgi:hypothetical protein